MRNRTYKRFPEEKVAQSSFFEWLMKEYGITEKNFIRRPEREKRVYREKYKQHRDADLYGDDHAAWW